MARSSIDALQAKIAALKHPASAERLFAAIEQKYADQIVVGECKDGPTQTRSHRRLDAWVLLKTWSPITTLGFEIKVSRSDFLNDKKLVDYLPLCHYLYVVAPKGMISAEELPSSVGLMESVGDHQRLIIRHKAVWRDIELPGELLIYVLMCRVKIKKESEDPTYRVDQLRQWVARKDDGRSLSWAVNQKIRDRFTDQERRLAQIETKLQRLESVKNKMIELGLDPESPNVVWDAAQKLREIAGVVDPLLIGRLEQTESSLREVRERLKMLKHQGDDDHHL